MQLSYLRCTIFFIMFLVWRTLAEVKDDNIDTIKARLKEEKTAENLYQNVAEIWRYLADLERRLGCNKCARGSSTIRSGHADSVAPQKARNGHKQTTNDTVGFTAELSTAQSYPPSNTVIFDRVLENHGGAYNSATGVFRAPYRGMYLFSITVHGYVRQQLHLELMKNHSYIGMVYSGDSKSDWGDTGSATVVTSMDTNDEVYVRARGSTSANINGSGYSSFMGVIISRF